MNISNNPYRIHGTEQAYHQFNPRVKLNNSSAKQQNINKPALSAQAPKQIINPRDILSSRELDTLQALFDKQAKSMEFYGHSRVKNVQSGFLLDVKG